MQNKTSKLGIAFVFISLALLNISALWYLSLEQKQTNTSDEFLLLAAQDPKMFVSVWNTSMISSGSSGINQVRLPLLMNGKYNFTVDWGDESNDTITIWNQTNVTHTYAREGINTIKITGTIVGWRFNNGGDRLKILEIQQWGCLRLGNLESYFYGCSNLELTATDNLDLTGTTTLQNAFWDCTKLGSNGNMSGWDVSRVTTMNSMFREASSFNQPIAGWDVSNARNMIKMFYKVSSFNQPIGDWNVSTVVDMERMFREASSFNQPIAGWDVSNVWDMFSMFSRATSFNQPIGEWDVSSVTTMQFMFAEAYLFNQPIGEWDVSSVTNMIAMFSYASSFNQSISDWDVSNVKHMDNMFVQSSSLNQTSSFNQPIGDWDVSSVETMSGMFSRATSFNQPIGEWDVSSVTTMESMFYSTSSFNQPIGDWDVSSVTSMNNMFLYGTLSTPNYDNLLLGWSQLSLQSGVTFDGGNTKYRNAAADARQAIITNFAWTIRDGGLASPGNFALSSNAENLDNDGNFVLTWTVSSRAINYSIYRHSNYITEINGSLTLLSSGITDLTLGLSGYTNGSYYFIVVAHNDYDDTLSNCTIVVVGLTPGDFTLSSNAGNPDNDGIFDLTWTVSSGAINYSVYRHSSYITEINGSLTLLFGEITDLTLGLSGYTDGSYYFIVVGHNDYGDTLSNCNMVVIDLTPGDFTLSSNAGNPDNDGNFNLSWTASSGAINYSVYRHSSYITEINGSLILLSGEITDLTLGLSGYTDGSYYFIVVAHNDYGDTLSNCIIVAVGLTPGDFTLSSNAGNPDNDGNFDLTWTMSSGATNYSVYRHSSYITEINGSLTLLTSEITDLTLNLSGYVDGMYFFLVVAHNYFGDTLSNCITVVVGLPPGAFTLSSSATTPDTDGTFDLTWTLSLGASNFSVYRHSSYITEINGSLTLLTSEITDLTLGLNGYIDGMYYFIAVAHNDYGDTLSNCITVVMGLPPGAFTLSSNAESPDNDGNFVFTWTVSSRAINYAVYRHSNYITEINGSLTLLTSEITDLTLDFSGYVNGMYYFIVVAHNDYGDTLSNCLLVTVLNRETPLVILGYDLILVFAVSGVSVTFLTMKKLCKKISQGLFKR